MGNHRLEILRRPDDIYTVFEDGRPVQSFWQMDQAVRLLHEIQERYPFSASNDDNIQNVPYAPTRQQSIDETHAIVVEHPSDIPVF